MPDELGGRDRPIDLTDSSPIATHPITASQVGAHTGTNTQGREVVRFSFQTPTHAPTHARQPRTRTSPSAGMRARAHTLTHPGRKGTVTLSLCVTSRSTTWRSSGRTGPGRYRTMISLGIHGADPHGRRSGQVGVPSIPHGPARAHGTRCRPSTAVVSGGCTVGWGHHGTSPGAARADCSPALPFTQASWCRTTSALRSRYAKPPFAMNSGLFRYSTVTGGR